MHIDLLDEQVKRLDIGCIGKVDNGVYTTLNPDGGSTPKSFQPYEKTERILEAEHQCVYIGTADLKYFLVIR